MRKGQIIEGRGGFYTIKDEEQGKSYVVRCKSKFRHLMQSPLVGDWVMFTPGEGEQHGWLEEILQRKSECYRPPVANVETLVILLAPEPEPDYLLADKLLAFAAWQGLSAVLVANQSDKGPELYEALSRAYSKSDAAIMKTSALLGEGVEELRLFISKRLCCFAGQSGVGKSSLISALTGLKLQSGAISPKIARGRQTTRHITLIEERGLRVLDTPGFSLFEFESPRPIETLKDCYREFVPYEGHCRFNACLHRGEPGCAVGRAVQEGQIDLGRYERYRTILAGMEESWKERYD